MYDVEDIIKNVENIYGSNNSFQVLKDFERVIDELDLYVYKHWTMGELVDGPNIERHWVTCSFMWPENKMPDPMGGKRLLDYDCKVRYKKSKLIKPRKIRKQDDIRPGTKKGKLDTTTVWVVEIQMPITLIADIYQGYLDKQAEMPKEDVNIPSQSEPADDIADTSDSVDLTGDTETETEGGLSV